MTKALGSRVIGGLRAVSGAVFLLKSHEVAQRWVGDNRNETAVLTRSVGARDFALGMALAFTGRPELLVASIGADISDALDALLGDVPSSRRKEVAAWALGFAGLALAAGVWDRRRE